MCNCIASIGPDSVLSLGKDKCMLGFFFFSPEFISESWVRDK